jgi:hypothetical protein
MLREMLIAATVVTVLSNQARCAGAQQTRLDVKGVTVRIADSSFAVGFDVLPLPGIRGFPFPRNANTLKARVAFGGQLGVSEVPIARNREAQVFILLPPPRPADGEPDYQIWAHSALIERYAGAAAVLIVSLDLTPLTVVRSLMEWRAESVATVRHPVSPPVLIISRAAANAMLGAEIETLQIGTTRKEMQVKFNVQTKRP